MKANHTWALSYRYDKCPSCGFINETRDNGHNVTCERCKTEFTVTAKRRTVLGKSQPWQQP